MELKAILTIGLCVFIVSGLIFLYIRNKNKNK